MLYIYIYIVVYIILHTSGILHQGVGRPSRIAGGPGHAEAGRPRVGYMYMCVCMCIYIYIYMYM